jgi:hypothetical protein
MKKTLLTLALAALSVTAIHAQGLIGFQNSTLTKIKFEATPGATLVDAPIGAVVFGVFWGTTEAGVRLIDDAAKLANVTTAGIINGGAAFAIPGTDPGQVIFLKIAGWDARNGLNFGASKGDAVAGHYGETDVRQVTLTGAPSAGQVIWQTATGTNPNRFRPFTIFATVPEPSVIALGALGLGALLLRRRKA